MPLHAQLISQLRALKLSGMIPSLEMRLLEAQQNTLAYSEFLSLIFSDELESRNNRKMKRSLAQAGLGSEQTIESFDFTFNPSVNAANIRELATCHFLHTGDGVFFLGPTGTGKNAFGKSARALRLSADVLCRILQLSKTVFRNSHCSDQRQIAFIV